MSRITQDIANRCKAVLSLSLQQGAMMHELRDLSKLLRHEGVEKLVSNLQSLQCSLQAECNSIKLDLAVGGVPPVATVQAHELELHPANMLAPGHGRALALERLEEPELMIDGHHRSRVMHEAQRAPTVEELERMERTLKRAGDDTELVTQEEHRHVSMVEEGGEG